MEVENFVFCVAFHYLRLKGDSADREVITDKGKLNHSGGTGKVDRASGKRIKLVLPLVKTH